MVACEEKPEDMKSAELELKVFNIEYAYKMGLLEMSYVLRLVKIIYGANDVSQDTHSIR